MKFSWFIGLRYLKPRGRYISLITLISIAGVALGVGVLLVVIAVISGFEIKIKEELLKAEPALVLAPPRDEPLDLADPAAPPAAPVDWKAVAALVRQHPQVRSVSPIVTVTSVVERPPAAGGEPSPDSDAPAPPEAQAYLIGIDPTDQVQLQRFSRLIAEKGQGTFTITDRSIILTKGLETQLDRKPAEKLLIGGTSLSIFGPSFLTEYRRYQQQLDAQSKPSASPTTIAGSPAPEPPAPPTLTYQGVIDDDKLNQQSAGFISLANAQRLNGTGSGIDVLTVELADPFQAGQVKADLLQSRLPPGWSIGTWTERNQTFFDTIASQRSLMYLILGIISVVAAFCIMNTMITMAVQKRKEIGMMRALGAKTSQIVGLFVTKGLIVAGLGVTCGYLLGTLFLHYRNHIKEFISQQFHWEIFDPKIYGLTEIPANARLLDNLIICGIAFILCTLAAVPPAWLVGRMDPARAMRTDR